MIFIPTVVWDTNGDIMIPNGIYIPMILSSFMTHGGIPKTMKPWQPWDDLGGKPVNPQLWPN